MQGAVEGYLGPEPVIRWCAGLTLHPTSHLMKLFQAHGGLTGPAGSGDHTETDKNYEPRLISYSITKYYLLADHWPLFYTLLCYKSLNHWELAQPPPIHPRMHARPHALTHTL